MADKLRIATRKSPLALWQAEYVQQALLVAHPGLSVELVPMSTRGDKILDTALSKIGGKGLFIKELEQALLEDRADIAVHSMKDVPMSFPDGLKLGSICRRHSPYDAFVSPGYGAVAELPEGARVGTSSLRRRCQLLNRRPDLQVLDCRGNVNTRLGKLDDGQYDAIILAEAGLTRLGMESRIQEVLAAEDSLPAPGQGAIGIEHRSDDHSVLALLEALNDPQTACEISAERRLNEVLEGGCQVPIAAFAITEGETLWLRGRVASLGGERVLEAEGRMPRQRAGDLGEQVARDLLRQGADAILQAVYAGQ